MKKIAVIGMSSRLPDADDLEQLHCNLLQKKVSMHKVSNERNSLFRVYGTENGKISQLKDIDLFDNHFFGISNKEAKAMSPEMRLSLENAAMAIMDAGYSLESLKGTDCGVITVQSDSSYRSTLKDRDAFSFIGGIPAMTCGNIAYYLDLRGPNISLASTCSSSLLALYEAAVKLSANEADLMLVGGSELSLLGNDEIKEINSVGIISKSGNCLPFDENADGTLPGEGTAFVLLKRYEDAVKDNDHIYGTILSGAVNGNGNRSGNPTAPSAEAQAEVISKAWKNAGVTSADITDIEAHGTATKVGDPIEISALNKCVSDGDIHISALKSNIGHLGNMSGIASLVKVLCGFKYNTAYPVAGLKKVNSDLQLSSSLSLLSEPYYYPEGKRRICGISSFGFNGTNVHIVVENNIDKAETSQADEAGILVLSVKSPNSYRRYADSIYQALAFSDSSVDDIAYTLNCCRDTYEYRTAVSYRNKKDLLNKLAASSIDKKPEHKRFCLTIVKSSDDITKEKLLGDAGKLKQLCVLGIEFDEFLLDGYGAAVAELADDLSRLDDVYNSLTSDAYDNEIADNNLNAEDIIVSLGASFNGIDIGTEYGIYEAAAAWIRNGGDIDLQLLYKDKNVRRVPVPCDIFDRQKLWGEITDHTGNAEPVYADKPAVSEEKEIAGYVKTSETENKRSSLNHRDILLNAWRKALGDDSLGENDSLFDFGANSMSMLSVLSELKTEYGIDLSVEDIYEYETVGEQAEYLDSISSDVLTIPSQPEKSAVISDAAEENKCSIKEILLKLWRDALGDEAISENDSVFDFGANSMSAMTVIAELKDRCGADLSVEDIYEYETIREQSDYLGGAA